MITDVAILATLRQGMPTWASKIPKDKLREFAENHRVGEDARVGGSVTYVPAKLVTPVTKAYWAAKNGFRHTVLPFPQELAGTSSGLVTAEFFPEFSRKVQQWERDWNAAVEVLCAHWPDVLQWQQRELGDLWDEDKHAVSVESIRERCKFVFTVRPIPSGDQLPQGFQQMAAALDAQVQTAMEDAQRALMEDFLGRVRWLAESLADEEATFNKGRGHQSPRDKMREFVRALPAMSLVKDPLIDALVADVLALDAMQIETTVLRTDKEVREQAALEALEKVKQIESLMQGV